MDARRTALLGALAAFAVASSPASAETVNFQSATTPPTPLQLRLQRERGQPIAEQPSATIAGELYRPDGAGPFPAVVVLHGCDGPWSKESSKALGEQITALGYAALLVDSFTSRGVRRRCHSNPSDWQVDRVMDAYGGLTHLAGLPFVDADRIAVLGFSQGAMNALSAVALGGIETLFERHFRAVVAYYPGCWAESGTVAVPTLILIGEKDDWTPARDCQAMMARRSGEGAPLHLIVYPGAYHAFNASSLRGGPREFMGHHLEYNEAADKAAWAETVRWLREAFGR